MTTRTARIQAAVQRLMPERRYLAADSIAALTFAVVNVPQAMAHALLATINPLLGIYALMVAVPVGAIFSSSVFMNVSTTGALSVAAGVVLAEFPADQKLQALVVLVFLVGVMQLLAGLLRRGFVIRFVSNAVMTGFLNGVAVLIILGQLSDLTGYQSSFSNRVAQALDLLLRIGQINVQDSIIGGVPAGGSVSGTVLIMSAGARSRWGNIFVGLFVALIVLLAGPLVERVPMPALAALLILAAFQGLRVEQAVMTWKTGWIPELVMVATFLATLTVPLQYAVLFGVVMSILLNTIHESDKVAVTQWVLQAQGFPAEQPPPKRLPSHQLTLLHVYGSLFFAAAHAWLGHPPGGVAPDEASHAIE